MHLRPQEICLKEGELTAAMKINPKIIEKRSASLIDTRYREGWLLKKQGRAGSLANDSNFLAPASIRSLFWNRPMPSLYDSKPLFQEPWRPLVARLPKPGIAPNDLRVVALAARFWLARLCL